MVYFGKDLRFNMKIIEQELVEKEGNDCIIKENFVCLDLFGTYFVFTVRKYEGWFGNDIDIRGRKEFEDLASALEYYNNDLRTVL